MEPLRICLENFMGHQLTDIDCTSFKSALIVGRNKYNDRESNGVGKTTIFKAIDYALFGEYQTKTVDKIIRDGADRCKVIFEFATSAGIFRVSRGRNKKSAKSDLRLFENRAGTWHDITQKTASEVEAELAKIVKISYKAFQNSVLFAQSDLGGLASSTPEARRSILKEALNLSEYSKYEKLAKEELSLLSDKLSLCKSSISIIGKPSEDLHNLKIKLEETKVLLLKKEEERDKTQESLNNSKIELSYLQKLISSDAQSIQIKLSNQKNTNKVLLNSLESSKKALSVKESSLKNLNIQLKSKEKELQQLINNKEVLSSKKIRTIVEIKSELDQAIQNEANGKAFISKLESEKNELETPFPNGDFCPHCRQHLSNEHKETCVKKIAEDLVKTKQELSLAIKRLDSVKVKKSLLEKEIKDLIALENNISIVEQQIATAKVHNEHEQKHINQLSEMIDRIKDEVANYSKSLDEAIKLEDELKKELLGLNIENLNSKKESLSISISKIENNLQFCMKEITTASTQAGIISEKINVRTNDVNRLKTLLEELKVLEKEYQLLQMVSQGFGSSGIPTMIIYTILDDLQIEANKLLSQIRPGLELQFLIIKNKSDGQQEDTLDICYRVNGADREFDQLSGGQKLMVALSLKLGLSLVIQNRLNTDIKFLELDEVDQSLDKAGVDAFADIIKKWQDRFKIFVITHNDALKNKFSNAILIENEGPSGSVGKVVTTW